VPPGPLGGAAAALAFLALVLAFTVRLAAEQRRTAANRERALEAANVMTKQIAERIRPLAGSQTSTVEAILQDVAGVYDDLVAADPSPDVRAGRGEMLTTRAAVDLEMNHPACAAEHAGEALRTFEELHAQDGGSLRYRAGLARSHEKLGWTAIQQGSCPRALEEFRAARALWEEVTDRQPDNVDWGDALGLSWVYLGNTLGRQGDDAGQAEAYRQALAVRQRLYDRHPEDKLAASLGRCHESLADYYFYLDLGKAAGAYLKALALYEGLVRKNESNAEWQRYRVRALTSLAQTYAGQGKTAEAEKCFLDSQREAERFSALNPANVLWRCEALRCRLQLALLRQPKDSGEQQQAREGQLKILEELLAITRKELAAQDPTDMQWPMEEGELLTQVASLYLKGAEADAKRGDCLNKALEALDRARDIFGRLVRKDETNLEWSQGLFAAESETGKALDVQGKKAEAQQAYLRAYRFNLGLNDRLVRQYPTSAQALDRRHEVANSHRRIAEALCKLVSLKAAPPEQLAEAQGSLEAGFAAYDALLDPDPANAAWLAELKGLYEGRALLRELQGDRPAARQARQDAQAVAALGEQAGGPGDGPRLRLACLLGLYRLRPSADRAGRIAAEAAGLARAPGRGDADGLLQQARDLLRRWNETNPLTGPQREALHDVEAALEKGAAAGR
jgi:hypothetical protein